MENSQIDLSCYWNNRIKNSLVVCFNLYFFYLEWKEILEKINKNLRLFLKNKNKKDRKNNFDTLKNRKKIKRKRLFS